MKTNRPWAKLGLIIAAAVALSTALIITACGKQLKSENIPSSNEESLKVDVVNASVGADGRYSVRANSRDTIEMVATVKGLSSLVGFYIPKGWGTFNGGTISTTDGFSYYQADRAGKARATLIAGGALTPGPNSSSAPTGRIEMVVRSLSVEQIIPLSFDFAALMILPPTMIISDTYHYTLNARGGLLPIEWSVSVPGILGYTPSGDSLDIYPLVDPNEFTGAPPVTVTARDAEGQTATATVTLQPKSTALSCIASTITVDPATIGFTLPGPGPTYLASITVVDPGNSAQTVEVRYTGPNPGYSGSLTLTKWRTPGVFQFTQTVAPAAYAGWKTTFIKYDYVGRTTTCTPHVDTAKTTITGT
jgi:hypothetical protein